MIYNNEFNSDLTGDWGLVQYRAHSFVQAAEMEKQKQAAIVSLCEKHGINPDAHDWAEKLAKTKDAKKALRLLAEWGEAQKERLENMDLEMTIFMQIVWALNQAQARKDREKEMPFMEWVEKYDEIKFFDVYEGVAEEVSSLFSSGGSLKSSEEKPKLQQESSS